MAHIHTNPGDHDFTASAYIVYNDNGTWKVLMHMHKVLHKWLQPGGHIEIQENPWDALGHELAEEAGLDIDEDAELILSPPLKGLTNVIEHPAPIAIFTLNFGDDPKHKHTDLAYAFISHTNVIKPAEDESQQIQWFSRKELAALSEAEIPSNVREIACYVLDEVEAGKAGKT